MKSVTRLGQTALTLTLGLYFVLVAFGNITDYGTNFQFVKHVLNMDSLPPDSHVAWRAINSELIDHLTYGVNIAWEAIAGVLSALGGIRMALRLKSPEFGEAKTYAIAGLWTGMLLWSLAFITIGGEWFMMWESATWNGELAALRMFTLNGMLLLFLQLVDAKTSGSKAGQDSNRSYEIVGNRED
jgi:predicted small integral membrane protein